MFFPIPFIRKQIDTIMKSSAVWDITPCSTLKVNRRFEGKFRLYVQRLKINQARNQREACGKLCYTQMSYLLITLFASVREGRVSVTLHFSQSKFGADAQ
jgi:hypothetical protein